jgi:hypothetical protein
MPATAANIYDVNNALSFINMTSIL